MQYPEIPPAIANAIVAPRLTMADPSRTEGPVRLRHDEYGQLWVVPTGVSGLPWSMTEPPDRAQRSVGYTALAKIKVWHPVHYGRYPEPTIAEVLPQLADDVREQVAGIECLGHVVQGALYPVESIEHRTLLMGWALRWARLYRRSRPVSYVVGRPFALPDGALDAAGIARLVIEGEPRRGRWNVTVRVVPPSGEGGGEVIGRIRTEPATHPGAADDVVQATRAWIHDALPPRTWEEHFTAPSGHEPDGRDPSVQAHMTVRRMRARMK